VSSVIRVRSANRPPKPTERAISSKKGRLNGGETRDVGGNFFLEAEDDGDDIVVDG
jgi:hypothetical protein